MERMDAIETKAKNVVHKDKERGRRDTRMLATIKGAGLPFAPAVMSWLSRKLDKPATRITPEDIKALRN
jgi:hypothetical protein